MEKQIQILSIEGNIGSGKSTVINTLKQFYNNSNDVYFLEEPVSEWVEIKDSDNKNIIEKFYEDHQVFKTIINQKQYYYTGHHHHFLVCNGCEKMIPVGCHIEGKEKAIGQPYGFQVTHHDMTLYGYCEHCQTH